MKLHLTVQTEFTTIAQIDQPGYIPNIDYRDWENWIRTNSKISWI